MLIRKTYSPPEAHKESVRERLAASVIAGNLTAEELLRSYYTLVYAQTRNFQESGRRLGVDGRTVKSRVDEELLSEFGRTK